MSIQERGSCRSFRLILYMLASLALASFARAQEINFTHFGISDGLPQTQVRAIHQDDTGYIWVGTYGGAARFNGREFVVFDTKDGLSSNIIISIASSPDRVWFGTTSGLCWQNTRSSKFHCANDPNLQRATIQKIFTTSDGELWLATERGLFRTLLDQPDQITKRHLTDINVTNVMADKEGTVWAATRAGLFKLDEETDRFFAQQLPEAAGKVVLSIQPDNRFLWIGTEEGLFLRSNDKTSPSPGLPENWTQDNINSMTLSISGDVWIGSNQGLLRHTRDGFALINETTGLMSNIIYTVFADREGVIWIGSDFGLSKYSPGPFVGYRKQHGLLHHLIRTMAEDQAGNLWLGSRAGAQLVPYQDGKWNFEASTVIDSEDGLGDERVYSIDFTPTGDALLATGYGLAQWREGEGVIRQFSMDDGLPTNPTQAVKVTSEGKIWIGTNLGVVSVENGKIIPAPHPELAKAYVFRIQEDASGRLWFGSQSRGLFLLDNGIVTQLLKEDGLTDKTIWDIAPDRVGGLWVGTNGDGLFHVGADGSIDQFTTDDGLVNDFVWQVLVDKDDRVWTYTNKGISRLADGQFRNYGLEDGLLHLEGGATAAIQTNDDTLWFASAAGVMRYVPDFESELTSPPAVIIENVSVGGKSLHSQNTVLPHKPGLIDIQYAALSYEGLANIEYRYRLRGASDEWTTTARYRPLSFANLGSGNYVFEVTARRLGGEWNADTASFAFKVQAPLWERPLFWLILAALLVLSVWTVIRVRLAQAKIRQAQLEEVIAERTEALKVANEQLHHAAITDPLTGLLNRRFFTNQISVDVAHAKRLHQQGAAAENRDIVFLMVDLDNFKEINDTYGHAAGDTVLKAYARLIAQSIRESDYVVRWGGEEFLVVARHTEASSGSVIAERIKRAANKLAFTFHGKQLSVTCSVGISNLPLVSGQPESAIWEDAIEIADVAVYKAKEMGRNGWVMIRSQAATRPNGDVIDIARSVKTDLQRARQEKIVSIATSFDASVAIHN